MGTLNAIYVRATEVGTIAAVREAYPAARSEAGLPFYVIEQDKSEFRAPEADLQALSGRLQTDVIWLSFQSVVDAFQYHHWSRGSHLRSLTYGCFKEREWERIEGSAEDWEAAVLFLDSELEWDLEYCSTDAERDDLRRIHRERQLLPGAVTPRMDSREKAREVAAHFGLPGWGLAAGGAR